MSAAAETSPLDTMRRHLRICVIGYADSTHVAARARCFAELGHEVFLLTESPSTNGIPGVTELVPAWDPVLARHLLLRIALWLCRKLHGSGCDGVWRAAVFVRLLRQCRPDVVHVHFAYSYYGWLAGIVGCRPLVVTVMGGDVLFEEQGNPSEAGKQLTLGLLRRADFITSKSHYLTEVLDRLGGFGRKAERIVWGISLRRFHRVDAGSLRASLGFGAERRVILSPKILQPLYRVHLIVEAMALLHRQFPDVVLLVTEYAADPEYKAAIERRIVALDLHAHVVFCGRVAHADMPAYYSLSEMAVGVPSSDGLPQTLLEAMACETPNILSKLPRYEEIVRHGESAYFVEATPEAIAAGMAHLLGDRQLCARIAGNAREIVGREGDLDEQALRVERRYRELAMTVRPRAFGFPALLTGWRCFRLLGRAAGGG